jgi:hypothetical protein
MLKLKPAKELPEWRRGLTPFLGLCSILLALPVCLGGFAWHPLFVVGDWMVGGGGAVFFTGQILSSIWWDHRQPA